MVRLEPIITVLIEEVTKSLDPLGIIKKTKEVLDKTTIEDSTISENELLVSKITDVNAAIAQELAIAYRIENSEEVIIEEYYEKDNHGKAGVTADKTKIDVGINIEKRKISKRTYTFRGSNNKNAELIEKLLGDLKNSIDNEILSK